MASVANLQIQGPMATVDAVRHLISNSTEESKDVGNAAKGGTAEKEVEKTETKSQKSEELKRSELLNEVNGDKAQAEGAAEVAAEVADSAENLDQGA